jgi:hypothetical protein
VKFVRKNSTTGLYEEMKEPILAMPTLNSTSTPIVCIYPALVHRIDYIIEVKESSISGIQAIVEVSE